MNKIPLKLRKQLSEDEYYQKCARLGEGRCSGRITWEHALTYAGRQVQERFAIIPLCVYHHLGPGLDKNQNREIALLRSTEEELSRYPNADWKSWKLRIIKKYLR